MLLFKRVKSLKSWGKHVNYHDLEKLTVTLLAIKFLKKARLLSISAHFGWIAKSGSSRSYILIFKHFFPPLLAKKRLPHYLTYVQNLLIVFFFHIKLGTLMKLNT